MFFKKIFLFFCLSIYSQDLSDVKFSDIQEIIKIVGKEEKSFNNHYIEDYLLNCSSDFENLDQQILFSNEKTIKFNDSIYEIFLILTKFFYLIRFYAPNFDSVLINELSFLRRELSFVLKDFQKTEDYFFKALIALEDVSFLKEFYKNFDESKGKDNDFDILEFYSDLNNPLNKIFLMVNKYFSDFFCEILYLYSSEKNVSFCNILNILKLDYSQNIYSYSFQKNANYLNALQDQTIVIDFYVKQLKYFLYNLMFLSNLKNKEEKVENEFFKNLQNLFDTYYFAIAFVGQYLYSNNLDEFLGIRRAGNFFQINKNLNAEEKKDAIIFFEKLNDYFYNQKKQGDVFDFDQFINFVQEKSSLIDFPQELEFIFRFVFLSNSYFKENTDEKKQSFFLEDDLSEGCSSFCESSHNNQVLNLTKNKAKKNQSLENNSLDNFKNFNLNIFFGHDKFCFEFLNKQFVFGFGFKSSVENILFGGSVSFCFNSLILSIHYFFNSVILFSFCFNVYKNYSFVFSFSNEKLYLGISYFFVYEETRVNLDLNYSF
ncbi:hypothetical protein [Alphaproteobacteria bacterium endosymbiont of Tiliacea citrago]|uniref:hypothetical protein n=1 Tax=Alphaproteobacteria bacterium endosymbiont of Tiliacea citrago TaxID=3077944 RepID=UPI00313CFD67